jgi:ABC-type multidrug transport system fused ATPase/permease subunit
MAGPTLRLIENYFDKDQSKLIFNVPKFDTNHKGFKPTIKLENVNFQYTKESNFGMENINLRLNPGNFIGIVGQSGAGKSTLVDLLLGVLSPSSGTVRISDTSAIDAIGTWPGAISYVPQEVKIINGSIRENVIVGYAKEDVSDSDIWKVLEKVSLSSFVNSLPRKLDEEINESGSNLSGGQKQRLGLARAWITNPKILILDEATSSLDAETENFISDILNSDRSDRIIISIAHRLTSIRLADSIIYVENGKIEASGNFEELRKISKKFDNQANLMGL